MSTDWPFPDAEDTEVITLERILRGASSILLVCHDADDHGWQFLDGEHVFEEDGAVVYLGDLVQLDPSLLELGDLPAGWYAWRAAPGLPWERGEGEPELWSQTHHSEPLPIERRNIEIKARVPDLDRLREVAASLSDTEAVLIEQEDVFFEAPDGRLKLRILGSGSGDLIHYHREDQAGPKVSQYVIAPTSDPEALRTILGRLFPVVGTVRKRRWLYRVGQTRIHLDRVEGLGEFLELEVVLRPGQDEAEGTTVAEGLMDRLGVTPDQLVPDAYIDLLRA
ncbi:MAG: class IV adenylate cyclase [Isosphaeraceae bacterium]